MCPPAIVPLTLSGSVAPPGTKPCSPERGLQVSWVTRRDQDPQRGSWKRASALTPRLQAYPNGGTSPLGVSWAPPGGQP